MNLNTSNKQNTTKRYNLKQKSTPGSPLIAYPHPTALTPPLCTVGWFAKTEIYVLANQDIYPVQHNNRTLLTSGGVIVKILQDL